MKHFNILDNAFDITFVQWMACIDMIIIFFLSQYNEKWE